MNNDEDLSMWFNLSRASFAVIPRVFMEAMPEKWQMEMARLLNEADEAFPNSPVSEFRVQAVEDGALIKMPYDLMNYRHPDPAFIARCRGLPSNPEPTRPAHAGDRAATEPVAGSASGGLLGAEPFTGETK